MENKFKQLKIQNWRQFDNVSVEFGERMTILTGANGSGKTTLLNLLSRHFWLVHKLYQPRFQLPGRGRGNTTPEREENCSTRKRIQITQSVSLIIQMMSLRLSSSHLRLQKTTTSSFLDNNLLAEFILLLIGLYMLIKGLTKYRPK